MTRQQAKAAKYDAGLPLKQVTRDWKKYIGAPSFRVIRYSITVMDPDGGTIRIECPQKKRREL